MNQPRFDRRTLLIVGLIVIVGILFIIPRLNQNQVADTPPAVNNPPVATQSRSGGNTGTTSDTSAQLGRIVAATSVDRDGCPVNPTTTFEPVERVYIVAEDSFVAAGTTVFVRLYRNNEPVEDAPEITADQDYNNSCVNFVFEPESGTRFQTGQYEAEFIVNGNPSDSVQFQIR